MKTSKAIVIAAVFISAAIIFQSILVRASCCSSACDDGRYVAVATDAHLRVNVIDTKTGAVRHCVSAETYGPDRAGCSHWLGGD